MATKQQVISLHARDPSLTSTEIAALLGCEPEYVRATFYRNGLKLPGRQVTPSLLRLRARKLIAMAEELEGGTDG
jgi:hypothetical protein